MKTDSIFYQLFKTFPEAFFDIFGGEATEARNYNFASVELKQTAFRIDGVFLPNSKMASKPIYFVEVQFQKDPELYARLFSELFLYLRLYAPTKTWRAVVIFASRSMEPTEIEPYRVLIESKQVTRLYLNELGDVTEQSLGVGMMKLVVETKKRTPELVKNLVDKTLSEVTNKALQKQVLDLIETIVLYKLPRISPQELAKMFRLSDFDIKKTRYYEEVRKEIKQEVKEEVKQEVKEEVKQEVKEEVKQEVKEEVKQEVKEEVKQEEALQLIKRLLQRRIGKVSQKLHKRINRLSVEQLENLAEALLDFGSEEDLATWLQNNLQ
ncbi:Rpn family recombination-promoting nuclease/putative transposase [Scytonema sp. UIC 10036]|uniref:Rpn family recombination-promoting nuclease/putative transposase n=1 Tax=Scytonema sp. UIC 10036 TaxID=2304196 RepID=UPI0012DA9D33|nr:Rpn family recombination-promoting nuclease/putative transposase [Scytonema sp. UIC 10036]MUH00849.1 Rpn family recombination-promoting nuclease/putative transposase [Scytonema sp. UIC 10036]